MKNIYNEILELNRGKSAGVLVTVVQKTGCGITSTIKYGGQHQCVRRSNQDTS